MVFNDKYAMEILLKFLNQKCKEAEREIETQNRLSDENAIPLLLKMQFNHIAHLDEELTLLRQTMDEGFAKVNKRFEQFVKKFELIDKKFDQIDKKFEQIDMRFEQIDKRFEQIEERFEQVDKRFEQIEKKFDDVDRRIEHIGGRIENVESKIDGINVRIDTLRDGINSRLNVGFGIVCFIIILLGFFK